MSSLLPAVVALGAPSVARAELGDLGTVSLSVDRLFGFSHTKGTLSQGAVETTASRTDFSLLIPPGGSPYTTPRLGIDVAVANGVTVGGSVGVIVSSSSRSGMAFGGTAELSSFDDTGLILAPRAGYVAPIGSRVRLWLRGGITYFQTATDSDVTDAEFKTNGFALTFEPTLVFMLAAHVGATLSGTFDLPLGGEVTNTLGAAAEISNDYKLRNLGAAVGIVVPL